MPEPFKGTTRIEVEKAGAKSESESRSRFLEFLDLKFPPERSFPF